MKWPNDKMALNYMVYGVFLPFHLLKCLWSEFFFCVFLLLVMSTFQNCQHQIMLKRKKIRLFAAQSSNLTTESGSILRAAKTIVLQGRDVGRSGLSLSEFTGKISSHRSQLRYALYTLTRSVLKASLLFLLLPTLARPFTRRGI